MIRPVVISGPQKGHYHYGGRCVWWNKHHISEEWPSCWVASSSVFCSLPREKIAVCFIHVHRIQFMMTYMKVLLSWQRTGSAGTGKKILAPQCFLSILWTHVSEVRAWEKQVVLTNCFWMFLLWVQDNYVILN